VVALHHGVGASVAGEGLNQGIPLSLLVADLRSQLDGRSELAELFS